MADKRAYADHWLSFWNDLLRNEYRGTGYIDGGRKQISVWLYQSLVENKPYNQFVHELISPTADSEGFINGIQWRGSVNASQTREVQFSQNISQVFFGINMKCASCHDSFVDDWKLSEAYGLAAIVAEKPLELHRCDKPTGEMAKAAFPVAGTGHDRSGGEEAERLKQLADLVTHRDNGRFARTIANRLWQRLMGRGLVHPVDALDTAPVDPQLLEYLANYLVEQNYDLKKLLEHIVTSRIYQSQAVIAPQASPDEYRFRGPLTKRMTAEQFTDAVWMLTGAGPAKIDAPIKPVDFAEATPPARRTIRAVLVHADLLQRSLGRPNREQVVTVRPDELTTLQALDLSNGAVLTNTLQQGADKLLKAAGKEALEADKLVAQIYQQALARAPQPDELQAAREFLGAKPDAEDDCRLAVDDRDVAGISVDSLRPFIFVARSVSEGDKYYDYALANATGYNLHAISISESLPCHCRQRTSPAGNISARMSAAGLAALVMNEPRFARGADQIDKPPAKADACILLWMAGGMASPETFDPKRYTPYEVGTPSDKILCTFPAIDTAVDNIKISEGLEKIAKVMDRATLIRSQVVADLGQHSPFAASVSLAHRLRPAANRGGAASRFVDRAGARPAQSGDASLYQHRAASRRRRRMRRAQGVYHGRFPRQRIRTVQSAVPQRRHRRGATAQGHDGRALRQARETASRNDQARSARGDRRATITRSR